MKISLVKPLLKIKLPNSVTDFRPISLLCTLPKTLERIIFDQVTEYLEANDLFDNYRKGFNAQTAILRVIDDMRRSIEENGDSHSTF